MGVLHAIFGVQGHVGAGQECARAALIFVYGLALIRISGRRTFGKWSALDVIVSVTAGSALSRALTGNAPLWGTLAAAAVLIALHWIVARGVSRSPRLSRWVEGSAVLIARNGQLDEEARRRHSISHADIGEALRRKGIASVAEAGHVTLEPNGMINASK